MLELKFETWSHPKTGTTYRWSLWQDGKRLAIGGPHSSPDESEAEAREFCAERIRLSPDRVTRL